VYPLKAQDTGIVITAGNLRVAPHLQHLYDYLFEHHLLPPMRDVNAANLGIFSRDVAREIANGTPGWENKVPEQVATMIKERRLLGYKGTAP